MLQQLQLHSKPHGPRFVTGSSGLTLRENFCLYISFGTSATQDTVSDLNPADEERRLALRAKKWPGGIWICVTVATWGKYKSARHNLQDGRIYDRHINIALTPRTTRALTRAYQLAVF